MTVETRDGRARISLSDPMARITSSVPGSSGLSNAYKPVDGQTVLDLSSPKWEALMVTPNRRFSSSDADTKGRLVGSTEDTMNGLPGVESSKILVENRIRKLAQELGRPVDCLEWPRPIDASAKEITLKIWRCGDFRTVEFKPRELLEVEGDPKVQRRLEERIRDVLTTT
jgi:hypothetical protein